MSMQNNLYFNELTATDYILKLSGCHDEEGK